MRRTIRTADGNSFNIKENRLRRFHHGINSNKVFGTHQMRGHERFELEKTN